MTLGGMLTLRLQLDFERGRMNSKFDTAAASIRKWTSKRIERVIVAACHIVLRYQQKKIVSIAKNIERNESNACFCRHPEMEFALGLINVFDPASSRDCAIIALISS
jgi:hypothetical protein